MKAVIQIETGDNVAVALTDQAAGAEIMLNGKELFLLEAIPAKHKFFLENLREGEAVIMYGVLVGRVIKEVRKGERVSTENTTHAAQPYDYRGLRPRWQAPDVSKFASRTFNGYHRSDGRVGTANYWLFMPTVFCENRNLEVIREALHNELGYAVTDKYKRYTRGLVEELRGNAASDSPSAQRLADRVFPHVDGIKFLLHPGGCGGTRQDAETLGKLLAAYADHPNVGGVTVLSLGCQHLQVEQLMQELKYRNPFFDKPLLVYEQQSGGSEEAMIQKAIAETFTGLVELDKLRRTPAPLSKLNVGVKCGGSDGFSGISANPSVGHCADLLVGLGATVLLAEFPELCGVEQELVDRCVDEATARKFIRLMREYDALAHKLGSGFHMNPSPGNIRDGLITDAMKSAGAARKGGSSPVTDVLDYTEPATKKGLNLVCTPGNDVEATTGKAASGATLILFTTGLGTPTGNPVAPTIKVATNSALALRMPDIIDIDTGAVIAGKKTIEEMGEEILEFVIATASGELVPKSVALNQDDFIPWKRGVSL